MSFARTTSLYSLIFVALFAFPAIAAEPGKTRPPNIVLLVADDQGYGEMHCQGGDIPTPHLDRLADSGVRFTSGYVSARIAVRAGRDSLPVDIEQRFGHEINPVEKMNDRPDVGLPVGQKTIADYLKAAGYVTGMFGKWHLGTHEAYHPLNRGFDEFFGFLREGHYYLPAPFDHDPGHVISHLRVREPDYNRLNPILRGRLEVQEDEYLTSAFARGDGVHRSAQGPSVFSICAVQRAAFADAVHAGGLCPFPEDCRRASPGVGGNDRIARRQYWPHHDEARR